MVRGQNVKSWLFGSIFLIICSITNAAAKSPAVMIYFVNGTEERFHLDHIDDTRVIVLKSGFRRKVIFSPSEIVWMRFRPEVKTKIPEGEQGVILADGTILNGVPVWMDDDSFWIGSNDRKRKRVELKKVIWIQFANSKDAIRIPTVSRNALASRVNVSATKEWTNANLGVKKGEEIWFTVGDYSSVSCGTSNQCALIGRIGDAGKPFTISSMRTPVIAEESGNLYLGVDDNDFKDNSGALDVFVKVIISSAQEEKNASRRL
jgi:hypothetical protein